jgi:hypothetical protein
MEEKHTTAYVPNFKHNILSSIITQQAEVIRVTKPDCDSIIG